MWKSWEALQYHYHDYHYCLLAVRNSTAKAFRGCVHLQYTEAKPTRKNAELVRLVVGVVLFLLLLLLA